MRYFILKWPMNNIYRVMIELMLIFDDCKKYGSTYQLVCLINLNLTYTSLENLGLQSSRPIKDKVDPDWTYFSANIVQKIKPSGFPIMRFFSRRFFRNKSLQWSRKLYMNWSQINKHLKYFIEAIYVYKKLFDRW